MAPGQRTEDVAEAQRLRGMGSWGVGLGLCILFAGGVAACGLVSDDAEPGAAGGAPTEESVADATPTTQPADTTAATDPPATDPPPTEPVATDPPPTDPPAETSSGVTYSEHIKPIVSQVCASCHTGNGPGTQHVRFDTAGQVARTSFGIAIVVEERYMPPWPASDIGIEYKRDWSLSDEEIATILEWDAAGSPLDVDPEEPVVAANGVVGIDEPDVVALASGAYDGEFGQPDEYRCFVYDPQVDEASFASRMQFIPEQTAVVHHAIGFLLNAEDRAGVDELDGADGNGGWTCFGFSPGRSAELVFAWAPGQTSTDFPDGTGLELQPGDFFVIQTHYHFDVEAPADQSTFAIEWADTTGAPVVPVNLSTYLAPAEIPCGPDESGPLCDRDAARAEAIAKYGPSGVLADFLLNICGNTVDDFTELDDGVASASCDWNVRAPGTIVSLLGHEHELGASFRMTLNPDTADEVVLLDIPKWDFDWQLNYEPLEDIVLERGDTIRIECTWDRALRDPALEPAYVLWADGTDDEMCFSTVVTRPN